MRKKLLSGAVTLSLGLMSNASAITIDIISMDFGSLNLASGSLSSSSHYGWMSGVFFGIPWRAEAIEYFDEVGEEQHFAGISSLGAYDYAFTLSAGQVAWGHLFDWSMSSQPPILNIMDCDENGDGEIEVGERCTGIGTPMQTGPFLGQAPAFNGVVTSVVPVPAAIWLFGSGLMGLFGFRRINN